MNVDFNKKQLVTGYLYRSTQSLLHFSRPTVHQHLLSSSLCRSVTLFML